MSNDPKAPATSPVPGKVPEIDTEEQTAESTEAAEEPIPLHTGFALTASEGNEMALAEATRLVCLVGPTRSGKTTLLLSIYEAFRKGTFCDCLFAGSDTLLGYEERCHPSRAASERDDPDTERTKADAGEVLLHLRIRKADGTKVNFLFADLSGELFDAAGQANEALLNIPFLKRADYVAAFLDGALLTDPLSRYAARQDSLTLLRAAAESGRFGKDTRLAMVFSKQDLVQLSPQQDAILKFQDETENLVRVRLGPSVRTLDFYRVIARPSPNAALKQLFSSWMAPSQLSIISVAGDPDQSARQIEKFSIERSKG